MKNLIIILFPFLLISCGRSDRTLERLNNIKAIGNNDPQLALQMLDSLLVNYDKYNEYERMKMSLLQIRLNDKAYIAPTSDLKIKGLVKYFDDNGTSMEKQEVHYYAGSVYRDLMDTPRALEHFLLSESICNDVANYDSTLLLNSYSNLHWLYYNVQDYHNALSMAQKEFELEKTMKLSDNKGFFHLGASYLRINDLSKAKQSFKQALQYCRTSKKNVSEEEIATLLYSFTVLNMRIEADECFKLIDTHKDNFKTSDFNTALGEYYNFIGKHDLAVQSYLKAMSDTTNLAGIYDASKALFILYATRKEQINAVKYAELFVKVSDSLNLGERQRLAATVNNAYQYHRNINEEAKIKEDKEQYRITTIYVVFLATLTVLSLVIIIFYMRNKRLKELWRNELELSRAKEIGQQLRAEIVKQEIELENAKSELKSKTKSLQEINAQLDEKTKELQAKSLLLEEKLEQNKQLLRLLHHSDIETSAEEIINAIRDASEGKYKMKAADWKGFYQAIEELYPSLYNQLINKFGKMDEQQLQMCYLLHAGFKITQIQNIIPRSRVTIWRWLKKYSDFLKKEEHL